VSPPLAMTCHLGSTYGADSGFRRHLWPRFSSCIADAAQTSLAAVFGTRGTVISPPMAMTCHLGSTYGDDSGFRRHLWPSFSSCIAEAAQTPLAAVFVTRGTVLSPPMAMPCISAPPVATILDFAATHGDVSPTSLGKRTICRRFGGSDGRRHPRRR